MLLIQGKKPKKTLIGVISEERQALIIRILSWSQRTAKRAESLTKKDMVEALNSRT